MTKDEIWAKQNAALRHAAEIYGTTFENAGITKETLSFKASVGFAATLQQLGITLLASREYEHLLIALNSDNGTKVNQTFFHLPHPSGIAIDRNNHKMYVAATRNPNQIIEFGISKHHLGRSKFGNYSPASGVLLPARSKFYPGEYYFHDLAICKNKLFANSVGMNCVIEVDMNNATPEAPKWWPKCIDQENVPDTRANYIQLNSIAMGNDLKSSFFSASGDHISARRPGHANYPVDKKGVIFSGKTREVMGAGLTRPHSARLHNSQVWVANSGYGQAGFISNGQFEPVYSFDGWTRGLCFVKNVLFVGVSRVLPRFRQYAPGIKTEAQTCAIVAIDTVTGNVLGDIKFPYGNQIFAIDFIDSTIAKGFAFQGVATTDNEKKIFSVSLV
jgi:uncharacterized protein (TIGR03032 family)